MSPIAWVGFLGKCLKENDIGDLDANSRHESIIMNLRYVGVLTLMIGGYYPGSWGSETKNCVDHNNRLSKEG